MRASSSFVAILSVTSKATRRDIVISSFVVRRSPLLLRVQIAGTGTRPNTATLTKALMAALLAVRVTARHRADRSGAGHRDPNCTSVCDPVLLRVEALRVRCAGGRGDAGKHGQHEK